MPSNLSDDDDDVPSFEAIIEGELGLPPREVLKWPKTEILPEPLMHLLPNYERWEFIGAGGMGMVYKAWHRDLLRWAAIKFLSPNQSSDPRALARFQNEATVLAQLRHPNIVPVHDFGCEGEVAWLVMDYLDGMSLQQWAQQTLRKPTEITRMVAKIARAVGVAHASGITHRDLKPGNILIVKDEPVLLDFGLAQSSAWQQDTRLTQVGELAGTVAYLAPEQVQTPLGEPIPATDVYACGIILFEMLAGHLPRIGTAAQIIARLNSNELPPRLRAFSKTLRKELDAICWCAMQKKPEDRYANGTFLAEDLERFLDGRPVSARNPDFIDFSYLYVRRNPWLAVMVVIALGAVILAGMAAQRVLWSQEKAKLLSQINWQLSEADWTPARLKDTQHLLQEMKRVDSVLERYLKEVVNKRTYNIVQAQLDAPRFSKEQAVHTENFLQSLLDNKHPGTDALAKRWQELISSWQTAVSLRAPINQEQASQVFRTPNWEVKSGAMYATPHTLGQTWSTLFSSSKLNGSIELEVAYGKEWQESKALGVNLVMPLLKELRFYVFQADRFAQYQPTFENPSQLMVMAIISDTTPLVYSLVPRTLLQSPDLLIRCRYDNGDLSLGINDLEPLRYTRIFELSRPLANASFSVLLPTQTSLTRLEIKQREKSAPTSPLLMADDLVSRGQVNEALVIYERYQNHAEVRVECQYKYAACMELLQRQPRAITTWEEVARYGTEPWSSLAMYQLWRCQLTTGDIASANAWFDLLMANEPPDIARTGVPTEDKLLINQHYLPITRSLNCLKVKSSDLAELDRAVRVQQFLGADERQLSVRTAMAFHFAGQDNRARQLLSQAVSKIRPSASLPGNEIHSTMLCLDQWAALGKPDGDAVLQATITSWLYALRGSRIPTRAVPFLEDLRRELRQKLPWARLHKETFEDLRHDLNLMPRHRVEAWLVAGLAEKTEEGRKKAWKEAVAVLSEQGSTPDNTQQKLHSEFVARCLDQSWTAHDVTEWLTAVLAKARPLVTRGKWAGPMMQFMVGESLARALNQLGSSKRAQDFAHDYILRTRPATELADEGMTMVLAAIFSEGTDWPLDHPQVKSGSEQIVKGFRNREFTEVALMQLFNFWTGIRTKATWDIMQDDWNPELRDSLNILLRRRYEKLGFSLEAEEFSTAEKEQKKPAPSDAGLKEASLEQKPEPGVNQQPVKEE